ncbi:LysR substrate-binding domain-containing protein [Chondromyces apiculatus]|uniref:Transcriptional regulator, LysR family n=1 Tax=Chondromyces apiculatus DSM 436 TaxID=1192034 RepID=A0A017THZ5_9BACT|nr:LysR substrate-binding domain-containing protein [Chondromyces apiculatus]EYF08231.1 transcriptional regulator, LysR family [Chondromyces apiculatus DSM 436]
MTPSSGSAPHFGELEQVAVRVREERQAPLDHRQVEGLGDEGRLLEWTLRRGKERRTLDVTGPLILDDMRSVLGSAREGNGLAYVFEQFAARDLASGALERVLPVHALVREAFYLYYPSRVQLPPKLRVFIDWFRDKNEPPGEAKPPRDGFRGRSS